MASNESAVLWSDNARAASSERAASESRATLPSSVHRWLERRLRECNADLTREAIVSVHCEDETVFIRHEVSAAASTIGFVSHRACSLSEWAHCVARTAKEWRLTVREGQRVNELRIAPVQRG